MARKKKSARPVYPKIALGGDEESNLNMVKALVEAEKAEKKKAKRKTKPKPPRPNPSRSPYHPFMLDLSGMDEKDADEIESALREKGL